MQGDNSDSLVYALSRQRRIPFFPVDVPRPTFIGMQKKRAGYSSPFRYLLYDKRNHLARVRID